MIVSGAMHVCYDARLLAEYRLVLARPKFRFDQPHIRSVLEQIQAKGELVAAVPLKGSVAHESDRPFAEVAVAARAEYLVTGNSRHFPDSSYGAARVVAPADLIELLRKT